jgi:hypothetical protein
MYNQNAEKKQPLTQTHTTPHYHESKPSKYQARRKNHLQLLAGSLSTLGGLLWEKVLKTD